MNQETLLTRIESLADPTRVRLLRLLERHELGVLELSDVMQLPQSTVSRHLKHLADRGWVRHRAQRTANLYRLAADELPSGARRLWQVTRSETEGWAALAQDQLRLERRLKERGADAQAFFASAATRWDKLRDELYGRAFPAAAMAALLPAGWTVADLGCGTAQMAATVAPHVKRVIGVDQSAAMLKAARKRVAGLANVELRQGELLALPIEDGACDGALMTLVLGYLPDPAPALAESFRVLAPGGRLVAIDVMRHDREEFARQMGHANLGFEPDALAGLLTSAGFEEIAVRPLPPEAGVKGPALLLATGTRPLARSRS
ncbi:MAG: metalloregulator ArsR/SmtB family transcription factor [Vicinamibacteria bacterium]|nr:metalloregulator ArsR/SmtB family transcription factor [Vicinamibacteria bacterium]